MDSDLGKVKVSPEENKSALPKEQIWRFQRESQAPGSTVGIFACWLSTTLKPSTFSSNSPVTGDCHGGSDRALTGVWICCRFRLCAKKKTMFMLTE